MKNTIKILTVVCVFAIAITGGSRWQTWQQEKALVLAKAEWRAAWSAEKAAFDGWQVLRAGTKDVEKYAEMARDGLVEAKGLGAVEVARADLQEAKGWVDKHMAMKENAEAQAIAAKKMEREKWGVLVGIAEKLGDPIAAERAVVAEDLRRERARGRR